MTLDELTRTLHEQAEEAIASSPDFVRTLPTRRRRETRRLLVVAVAPLVVAVVAVLTLVIRPGVDDGSVNRPVGPAASPSVSPSAGPSPSEWEAVDCAPSRVEHICAPPQILERGGQQWWSTAGGRQPVHNPSGTDLQLSMSAAGSRLMVVGALRSGPGSRLTVRIGDAPPIPLPDAGLTVVPLPAHAGDVEVTERGEPGPKEMLALESYVPLQ